MTPIPTERLEEMLRGTEGVADPYPSLPALVVLDADVEAPCPACFESSGYVWEHGTDWESGPWSHQTSIPCRVCHGTGLVPCEVAGPDDDQDNFNDPGYIAALDEETF